MGKRKRQNSPQRGIGLQFLQHCGVWHAQHFVYHVNVTVGRSDIRLKDGRVHAAPFYSHRLISTESALDVKVQVATVGGSLHLRDLSNRRKERKMENREWGLLLLSLFFFNPLLYLGRPPITYLINIVVLNLLRVQTVAHQVQAEDLGHSVSVPDDVLQVGVVPGLVAGREHGQVLHVPHAIHEFRVKVVDGLPELVQWSVVLFLIDNAGHAHKY